MVPTVRGRRGRTKLSWMDCVNRDTGGIGTTEVHDMTGWMRIVSAVATPQLSESVAPTRTETESFERNCPHPKLEHVIIIILNMK